MCTSRSLHSPQVNSCNLPTVGECSATGDLNGETMPCDCPPRTKSPLRPKAPYFPATSEHKERLQHWLLNYYASSAFNTCTHTQLSMMDGPTMRLMVDPESKPVAHHTPILVPIHWQDEVKAGLDRDLSLGVIEPVLVGTPLIYCDRMVICA